MGMAEGGRYLTRLAGAKKLLLLNKSTSSAAPFSARRPQNHLIRLLAAAATTTTTNTRYGLSAIVEGNLSIRAMSTLGLLSSLDDYEELKPTSAPAGIENSQDIANYERSSDDSIYFSVDDLDIYSQYSNLDEQVLEEVLPVMYRTLRSGEWSLLQRYCCSKDTDTVDIKVALENELAAMCVWFLCIDVPTHVKVGLAWALKDICSRTSEAAAAAANMHNDEERVTRQAPSIDQESVNALLVDVLCSKNEEVLRQVCFILGFVSKCRSYQTISFGDGIQNKLIQLSRNFSYDSPVLVHILFAIVRISVFSKGMKEKFIEAEFSDGFLRRILREVHHDSPLAVEAYFMVYIMAQGHCNDELWKYIKEHLMSAIVDRCFVFNIDVMRSGACLISSFIAQASPRCIKELVDLGCLKTLIHLRTSDDVIVKVECFKAVETILGLGDADPSKNKYAKMIDDLTKECQVCYVNNPQKYKYVAEKGSDIVKYRRDKYPAWCKKYLGGRVI